MANLEVLLSVAEISVAFAGFAGIVTALANRDQGRIHPGNLTRFQLMIYSSVLSTLFALFPFCFALFEAHLDWAPVHALFAAFLSLFLIFQGRVFYRQVKQQLLNGYVSLFLFSLGCIAALIQWCASLGLLESGIAPYFLGVFYLLLCSGVSFIRLLSATVFGAAESKD